MDKSICGLVNDALLRLLIKNMHLGKVERDADCIARPCGRARVYTRGNAELVASITLSGDLLIKVSSSFTSSGRIPRTTVLST